MKKLMFISGLFFVMNVNYCFSQSFMNGQKEYKSDMRIVYGYSNDFNELNLGITFGKVINLIDTTYYIKFQIFAPNSALRQDIQLNRSSSITFLSKSGKTVDLKMTDVISLTENNKQVDNQYAPVKSDYSTILILKVTREQLVKIGSEPFYNIIIPYFNSTFKVDSKAIFVKPTLFSRRNFTQRNINYILDIY